MKIHHALATDLRQAGIRAKPLKTNRMTGLQTVSELGHGSRTFLPGGAHLDILGVVFPPRAP